MDFSFSDEDQAFREEVRAFLAEELGDRDIVRGGNMEAWKSYRQFIQKLAAKGWLTLAWPEEWGGQGATYMKQLVYNEEMAYHNAPANDMGSDRVGPTIMLYGTDEQKQRFLPPIVAGEAVWCQGFSEPEAGSDLASLQLTAVEDGDEFVVRRVAQEAGSHGGFPIILVGVGGAHEPNDIRRPGYRVGVSIWRDNARRPTDPLRGPALPVVFESSHRNAHDTVAKGCQRVIARLIYGHLGPDATFPNIRHHTRRAGVDLVLR